MTVLISQIRTARKFHEWLNKQEGEERQYMVMLFTADVSTARTILLRAKEVLGNLDWIKAGLECKKDADIAEVAISKFSVTHP
jgi:hypothetical protein